MYITRDQCVCNSFSYARRTGVSPFFLFLFFSIFFPFFPSPFPYPADPIDFYDLAYACLAPLLFGCPEIGSRPASLQAER